MKKVISVILILLIAFMLICVVQIAKAQEIYRDQYVSISLFQAPGANVWICIENVTNYTIYSHFEINGQLVNTGLRYPGVVYAIRSYPMIVNKTVKFTYWKYNLPNSTSAQQYEYLGQWSMFMNPLQQAEDGNMDNR